MKTAICPKCFANTTEDKWVYACQIQSCKAKGRVVHVEQVATATGRVEMPACPECGQLYPEPMCHLCGYPVRENAAASPALSVSLVGAEGSGKSHFVSVLIDELKNNASTAFDFALYPVGGDETTVLYDRQYYNPLYVKGRVLDKTEQDDIYPLIYSMIFAGTPPKTFDLTIYDSCGENFQSISAMANFNRSIYHSGGILFLIDPSQLPFVADYITTHGKGNVNTIDPFSLLTRTIQLIRTGQGNRDLQKKLDIPIAVCLTKLDTVYPILDASSFLKAPSRQLKEASFEQFDMQACNLEAQSLIEAWGGGELVRQVTTQFSDYAFFGLSAIGSAPSDSGSINRIVPHRVVDPLLWLLWKNGAIT